MKRDLELVKQILLRVEEREHVEPKFSIPGYDDKVVSYHVAIMNQAGLVEAIVHKLLNGEIEGIPMRMTWQGHEWLDLARNNTVWEKSKKRLGEKALTASFDVMKLLLVEVTKEVLFPGHPH